MDSLFSVYVTVKFMSVYCYSGVLNCTVIVICICGICV